MYCVTLLYELNHLKDVIIETICNINFIFKKTEQKEIIAERFSRHLCLYMKSGIFSYGDSRFMSTNNAGHIAETIISA